jgi:hypothetical protein
MMDFLYKKRGKDTLRWHEWEVRTSFTKTTTISINMSNTKNIGYRAIIFQEVWTYLKILMCLLCYYCSLNLVTSPTHNTDNKSRQLDTHLTWRSTGWRLMALLRKNQNSTARKSTGLPLVPDPDRERGAAGRNPDWISGNPSYQIARSIRILPRACMRIREENSWIQLHEAKFLFAYARWDPQRILTLF